VPTENITNFPPTPERKPTFLEKKLDREDAAPLSGRRVTVTALHDVFGTKDVQDVVTATYVWLTDESGHTMLGIVFVATLCWGCNSAVDWWAASGHLVSRWHYIGGYVLALLVPLLVLFWKEFKDYKATRQRAGKQFEFDKSDVWWNVKTVLFYAGAGGLIGAAPFIHLWALVIAFALALGPAIRIGLWWLRRKLAFQQAGLPYLYRLANFSSGMDEGCKDAVVGIANYKDRPISAWRACVGPDTIELNDPAVRHILIAGPLRCGKTSLATGIGTEFAFALGIGRYLTAAQLMGLIAATLPGSSGRNVEYSDGRVLWPWRQCDLLIVDDIDGGMPRENVPEISAAQPDQLRDAFQKWHVDREQAAEAKPLAWLGKKRSVWVLGDASAIGPWQSTIAGLLNVDVDAVKVVKLAPLPPRPSDAGPQQ